MNLQLEIFLKSRVYCNEIPGTEIQSNEIHSNETHSNQISSNSLHCQT